MNENDKEISQSPDQTICQILEVYEIQKKKIAFMLKVIGPHQIFPGRSMY